MFQSKIGTFYYIHESDLSTKTLLNSVINTQP